MTDNLEENFNPYFYDPFNEFGAPDRSGEQMVMDGFEDLVIEEQLTLYDAIRANSGEQSVM